MLELGFTKPRLANSCLNKSNIARFYPFRQSETEMLEELHEEGHGWWTIHCFCKIDVDKAVILHSVNCSKAIIGIDATQVCPYSMCEVIPIGF